MVFRRDNKPGDAFQRQMSALRQQLGSEGDEGEDAEADAESTSAAAGFSAAGGGLSDAIARGAGYEEYGSYDETSPASERVTGTAAPAAPEMPSLPAVDANTTVIAGDTAWKGDISSEGTVHVHGRFEGTMRVRDRLFVAGEANVDATITAGTLVVAGALKGTVRCDTRLEVLPTGRITGDVHAPTFVVHEGATMAGQVRMSPGDSATTEKSDQNPALVRRAARGSA